METKAAACLWQFFGGLLALKGILSKDVED